LANGADVNASDSAKLVPRLELKAEQTRANALLREQFVKKHGVLRTLLAIQTAMAPDALEISRDEAKSRLLKVESIHFKVHAVLTLSLLRLVQFRSMSISTLLTGRQTMKM